MEKTSQQLRKWLLRSTPHTAIRRIYGIAAAIGSDLGSERSQNQDRVLISRGIDMLGETYILLALSDGMGGMQGGEDCAATTLAVFASSFSSKTKSIGMANDWLISAAMDANKTIFSKYKGSGGATLSAVLVRKNNKINWLNAGDSRIYEAKEKSITQLTIDDTLAGQLGQIEGSTPRSGELLQYIGMGEGLEPHASRGNLQTGDSILITSDGIHYLDQSILERIVIKAKDPGTCLRRIIEVAKWCGGHDNCSAIYYTPTQSDFETTPIFDLEISDPYGELQISTATHIEQSTYTSPPKPLEKQKKPRTTNRKTTSKKPTTKERKPTEIKTPAPTENLAIPSSERIQKTDDEKKIPQLKMLFPLKDE